jgi:hypothetical protein
MNPWRVVLKIVFGFAITSFFVLTFSVNPKTEDTATKQIVCICFVISAAGLACSKESDHGKG